MSVEYIFSVDDKEISFTVDLDREFDFSATREDSAEWTKLTHNQCSNCPLTTKTCSHCPAAVDLEPVIKDFQQLPAQTQANIRVITDDREYFKKTSLEEGVRSLMGLIMATSACPILAQLKPNAQSHLPFATQDEFILRASAIYLLREYFTYREGGRPDWDMQGLIKINQELQILNQAFWQRVHDVCDSDTNLKALLSFFNLSSSVSYSLETQLQQIKPLLLKHDDPQEPDSGAGSLF
ncbi:MAG: hypothetical protein COA99_12205 [Moraxellaceae bacterium]|nr:MAG: hypothetical protein COA99_12205 [Moraxellaceae bacterium]